MTETAAFDQQAAAYDAWFERHEDIYLTEVAALRSAVPIRGTGVEIGVGTGRFALPLGISIGVEPAPRMAKVARSRGVKVYDGVAEALPFADGSFDFAVMVTVVCFFDDVAKAFREAWRILKPGGVLVLAFIDRDSELGRNCEQRKDRSMFYRDAIFYSVDDLSLLLREAGFDELSYRQALFPGESAGGAVREGFGDGGFVVVKGHKK